MKKVALITYYGENYGGMLQAYALQRCVTDAGYVCKIISNDFLYSSQLDRKQIFRKLKTFLKNPIGYLYRRSVIRKVTAEKAIQRAKFSEFRSQYIDVDHNGYVNYEQFLQSPPKYDVYLCGSDQIWNPNLYHSNGFYFADFAPKESVKISYASSIGVSSVTEEQAAFMKPYLDKLDVISTRETEGSHIVRKITGKDARTVLDPTLLLRAEQWSEIASKRIIDKPYVFCYLFGERDYIENVKKRVKDLTGFEIVSIPYTVRELVSDDTKIFDVGPAEFISLIKNAELVLTDSFHATVFSINFKVPFLSLCRFAKGDAIGMNSRLTTILGELSLKNRLFDENDEINREELFDVDFDTAHNLLDEKRALDFRFLIDSIEYAKKQV